MIQSLDLAVSLMKSISKMLHIQVQRDEEIVSTIDIELEDDSVLVINNEGQVGMVEGWSKLGLEEEDGEA